MWLVLADSADVPARWAYEGLGRRGLEPLEFIEVKLMSPDARWAHRLGCEGISLDLLLPDGRRIRSQEICGALNRIQSAPMESFARGSSEDRDYASQEFHALFMSWLHALPGQVLNRSSPQGLAGAWRGLSEWVWLAGRAGLPCPDYVESASGGRGKPVYPSLGALSGSRRSVITVAGRVVGHQVPAGVAAACGRLSELARTPLLGIDLTEVPERGLVFAGASPWPDLRLGGEPLLDALAEALTKNGANR
ncbi:MAG: hypothetical protein QNK18_05210 [Gammaproteobacteria bacterium]|nr:hypothetical protein [Gammaproteobacteria bacterium]MDJ0890579.1 hypothetical protein [Gammaproteobacteria bacterium]